MDLPPVRQKNSTALARLALRIICDEIDRLTAALECIEREVALRSKEDVDVSRLMTIPGIGPITATTLKAYVPDFSSFKSARHFASWLGLTPIAQASGGSVRAGAISKEGNPILRWYLVMGTMSVIRHA
ncbi:transposase [Rhizobium sp. 768_B6_N1_8]|uniref:transposase n=1 Tax=unclassified Rhizobium TaxID=2613769 RepID=UPI003F256892